MDEGDLERLQAELARRVQNALADMRSATKARSVHTSQNGQAGAPIAAIASNVGGALASVAPPLSTSSTAPGVSKAPGLSRFAAAVLGALAAGVPLLIANGNQGDTLARKTARIDELEKQGDSEHEKAKALSTELATLKRHVQDPPLRL
jgi:hypothetical protein